MAGTDGHDSGEPVEGYIVRNTLTKTLERLRDFAADSSHRPTVEAIAMAVIGHVVETLRRAGLAEAARRILAGHIDDLDTAAAHTKRRPTPPFKLLPFPPATGGRDAPTASCPQFSSKGQPT